jgi:hypothetical protein
MKHSSLVQKLSEGIKSAVKVEKVLRVSGDGGILSGSGAGGGGAAGRKSDGGDITVRVSGVTGLQWENTW